MRIEPAIRTVLGLLLQAVFCAARAQDSTALNNLLPNPSFERTEPPPPSAGTVLSGAPVDAWLPTTWELGNGGAVYRCLDDGKQAHSGRRCVYFDTRKGGAAHLRYSPIPVAGRSAWTVRFWARGTGQVKVLAHEPPPPDRWVLLGEQAYLLQDDWRECEFRFTPPDGCAKWCFSLRPEGQAEVWLDDLLISCPGLPALDLPPTQPVGQDEHTLLYLSGEEPLDEARWFQRGQVSQSAAGAGHFGKSFLLGTEGYVASSADDFLKTACGTIELWVRFASPGNDGICHAVVSVPGPDGMMLCKDQYGHVSFGFGSGWARLCGVTAMGYAWAWQPGVWRHVAACWDREAVQLFVDGKLVAWEVNPRLARAVGPELGIGGPAWFAGAPSLEFDDLRISDVVRYRLPLAEPAPATTDK
jgi:hypothetical protein